MKFVSPLHLHKGLSGAHTAMLAVVPPCAGECRFVRVIPVLIFFGARTCGVLCCSRNDPASAKRDADPTITLPRPQLLHLLTESKPDEGNIDAGGNVTGKLAALLDAADPEFAVVTP